MIYLPSWTRSVRLVTGRIRAKTSVKIRAGRWINLTRKKCFFSTWPPLSPHLTSHSWRSLSLLDGWPRHLTFPIPRYATAAADLLVLSMDIAFRPKRAAHFFLLPYPDSPTRYSYTAAHIDICHTTMETRTCSTHRVPCVWLFRSRFLSIRRADHTIK